MLLEARHIFNFAFDEYKNTRYYEEGYFFN